MSQLKHPGSEQSALYRPQEDSPTPWMVSSAPSQIPAYYLPTFQSAPWSPTLVCDGATKDQVRLQQDCVVQRTIVSTRQKKGANTRFWSLFKELFQGGTKRGMKRLDALTVPFNPRHRQKDEHFTHPAVNRVQVHNSTFQCSSSVTIKPDDLWTDLHNADDSHHPGNRPGGIEHSTLHPQPSACPRIRSPHSHHVRLNPYLQHHCNGPHPITFDITRGSKGITHTTHAPSTTPLDLAHLSQQPATYPSITRMHIQPVAEDPLPHFPWPIEVVSAHGITCGDVFDAIARKFLEHVSEQEYNNWTRHRQSMAARTYHQRVGTLADPTKLDEVQEACEGLRCIDYVGGKVVFHGLEQACATMGDTWFMYLGAGEGSGM